MTGKNNMYCGVGPIPKGKIRGTPEYCAQINQVRYYGIELIDEDLLNQAKGKASVMLKEQLKLKKIEDTAKILIKDAKKLKIILEDKTIKPSQQKKAQKKMDALLKKRDKLVKHLKSQKAVVDAIEQEEKRQKKLKLKTKSTSKKLSGSKNKK